MPNVEIPKIGPRENKALYQKSAKGTLGVEGLHFNVFFLHAFNFKIQNSFTELVNQDCIEVILQLCIISKFIITD